MPDAKTLLRCFLRTYLVGAGFNTRGLQNIGLVYAMEPALESIYPDPAKRKEARKRYLKHYNTHPFWTPLLVGTFLSLEVMIAAEKVPPQLLTTLKDTTTYTLSAIGDSVFGGSFLVLWSLVACALLMSGHTIIALLLTVGLSATLQLFKLFTFIAGLREGLKVLNILKGWNLINWGERLKVVNALVVVLVLCIAWPGSLAWQSLGFASVALTGLAFIVGRLHISRIFVVLGLVVAALVLPHSLYTLTGWFGG